MSETGYTLFDTAIGWCGIAWNGAGIVLVQLPEASARATRARVVERLPGAREGRPPRPVQRAVDEVTRLLRGEKRDLGRVALDMSALPAFQRAVYEAARAVPPGETVSYGEIARRAGRPNGARAVGQALSKNPFPIVVPCHRVLAAGGKIGGFTAEGGVATKQRILAIEGAAPARAAPPPTIGSDAFDARAALAHLRDADPALGRLIDAVGPFRMRIERTASIFAALGEAIVYQQLTGKAAATIHARVRALFPRSRGGPRPEDILGVPMESLRGAGLSNAKALALIDLARHAKEGKIPTLARARRLADEQVVERLVAVRGVGRWTVQMLLMFRLGRPDVLPVDDYGVRKGFQKAFRKRALPDRKELERRGERWRPYRSVASWYLWRATDGAAK